MCTIRKLVLSLFVASILSGCAARRYQPVPIVSTQTASMLETRSFGDSGLHVFLEKYPTNMCGQKTTKDQHRQRWTVS